MRVKVRDYIEKAIRDSQEDQGETPNGDSAAIVASGVSKLFRVCAYLHIASGL